MQPLKHDSLTSLWVKAFVLLHIVVSKINRQFATNSVLDRTFEVISTLYLFLTHNRVSNLFRSLYFSDKESWFSLFLIALRHFKFVHNISFRVKHVMKQWVGSPQPESKVGWYSGEIG